MRATLGFLWLIACSNSALAQSGVSTQRDMYGNLVRSTGTYSPRGINQGPVNNGPIFTNGSINSTPQPRSDSRPAIGTTK
jgi:hypothetical protein